MTPEQRLEVVRDVLAAFRDGRGGTRDPNSALAEPSCPGELGGLEAPFRAAERRLDALASVRRHGIPLPLPLQDLLENGAGKGGEEGLCETLCLPLIDAGAPASVLLKAAVAMAAGRADPVGDVSRVLCSALDSGAGGIEGPLSLVVASLDEERLEEGENEAVRALRDAVWEHLKAKMSHPSPTPSLLEVCGQLLVPNGRWGPWAPPSADASRALLLHTRTVAALADEWPGAQVREADVATAEAASALCTRLIAASGAGPPSPPALDALVSCMADVWGGGAAWPSPRPEQGAPGPLHEAWAAVLGAWLRAGRLDKALRVADSAGDIPLVSEGEGASLVEVARESMGPYSAAAVGVMLLRGAGADKAVAGAAAQAGPSGKDEEAASGYLLRLALRFGRLQPFIGAPCWPAMLAVLMSAPLHSLAPRCPSAEAPGGNCFFVVRRGSILTACARRSG